jgi:hypothetical protein
MAENKTKVTEVDPHDFIKKVDGAEKQKDSEELIRMMSRATGKPPKMWGPTIVGFGKYHYKYESGREGDMCLTGFSPRKPSLVLYIGAALKDSKLMARLGKYKVAGSCLYIKKLADIDRAVLKELIAKAVAEMRRRYDCD